MGIRSLQEFIETHCASACVSVDLLKISRGFIPKRRGREPGNERFCLVVDAESCLDRLYGGYFSDWVCGGQWNRMMAFLNSLMQACHSANLDMVVFFNGALESQKLNEWYGDQLNAKKKVTFVLRHINNKGTPPPKVWWIPPVFLQGALRMALRQMGIGVACSMDDHAQEVIGYCREHGLQGIIAQDPVYTIFDPPRYFSSQNLKLTYKGSLETKEYIMDEIAKNLDLNPNRFCILAALLGNHILPDEDLYSFYIELLSRADPSKPAKLTPENAIQAAVDFVRNLPSVDNLDEVGEVIFRNSKGNKLELVSKFKQCVQYYLNGTNDGFLKYRPRLGQFGATPRQGNYAMPQRTIDAPGFAGDHVPQVVVDPPTSSNPNLNHIPPGIRQDMLAAVSSSSSSSSGSSPNRNSPEASWSQSLKLQAQMQNKPQQKASAGDSKIPPVSPEIMRIASERHQKGLMHPWIYQLLSQGEMKIPVSLEDEASRELPTAAELYKPIRQSVYSVLFNLNKLKIIHENQVKEKGDGQPASPKSFDIPVKEWSVRRNNARPSFDMVIARPVDWKTPSIERMWLGQQVDDKTRRLRAFFTCMDSDTPLMLNTQYVPQQLLILCCVLRYLLRFGRILQRLELDAFLAMSVSPLLHDVQTMQDLKLPNVLPRGIHLASLFMSGVETAVFANDVCGAPIPWNMCLPWQFFDGKLFHFKLLKATNNTPLIDMCDGQVDQVLQVERMRQAIMEGLQFEFAKPMLPAPSLYTNYPYGGYPPFHNPNNPMNFRPAGMGPPNARMSRPGPGIPAGMGPQQNQPKSPGRGRGILGRSPVDARGGQLEIAGVVVGSWGPNIPTSGRGRNSGLSPRVMSVGRGGNEGNGYPNRGGMNPMRGGMPPVRGGGSMGMGGGPMMFRGMNRPIRGRMGQPMYGYGRGAMRMPMDRGYPFRGRGVVRGVRRPQVKVRPRPGKSKTTTKPKPNGKGRGTTIEIIEESVTITQVNGHSDDAYEDADETLTTPVGKGKIYEGIQSPDSGIHGDKSATDINA